MKRSISIIGSILLATALTSPAWAKGPKKGGGGESQAGGLPALEDRVEADEALIATLQSQVAKLQSDITALQSQSSSSAIVSSECRVLSSSGSAGPVSATPGTTGQCVVTFSKNVSACAFGATIVGTTGGEISVASVSEVVLGDSVSVSTFVPAETPANSAFDLTVTCP